MIKNLINKIKKSKETKQILKDEAEFLKRTDKYSFFGYFVDPIEELPVFITESVVENNCAVSEMTYASTPKRLEHCVKHLTNEVKLQEAKNIDEFVKKCNKLAKHAKYQEESWEDMIDKLTTYLQGYSKVTEKTV